jgi:hypothetical protein
MSSGNGKQTRQIEALQVLSYSIFDIRHLLLILFGDSWDWLGIG